MLGWLMFRQRGVLALPAGEPCMFADDVAPVEHGDHLRGDAHPQQLAGVLIRDGVVLRFAGQVVVPPYLYFFPDDVFESVRWERGKLSGLFGFEEFPPGRAVRSAQHPVDLVHPLIDRFVDLGKGRPHVLCEVPDHTLVDDIHCVLGCGLVPGFPGSGGHDRAPVMLRELLVTGVDHPLPVPAPALMRGRRRVIRDDHLHHPTKEGERLGVRVKPCFGLLVQIGPAEHDPGVREHRDEQERLRDLPGDGVDDIDRVTCPIDLHRPARDVLHRRDEIIRSEILAEEVAVLRVPVLLPTTRTADIPGPGLLQGEVLVRFHRLQHPPKPRLFVLVRDAGAPVGKQHPEINVGHHRKPSWGDLMRGDRFLCRGNIASRASSVLDDVGVAVPCEHELHDFSMVGHSAVLHW